MGRAPDDHRGLRPSGDGERVHDAFVARHVDLCAIGCHGQVVRARAQTTDEVGDGGVLTSIVGGRSMRHTIPLKRSLA